MYLQDWNKARHATRILNYLLTRKSEIDPTNPSGVRPVRVYLGFHLLYSFR